MSLSRVKIWKAGEPVADVDINGEFDNILTHATDLLSPLTRALPAGGFKVTGLATGSAAGDSVRYEDLVIAATQADQETGSSVLAFVSPGRQQFHPSACKGWATADFAGASVESYNLTSITDSGTGFQTYVWATDFSSALFTAVGSVYSAGFSAIRVTPGATAGTSEVRAYGSGGSVADAAATSIAAYGDQA